MPETPPIKLSHVITTTKDQVQKILKKLPNEYYYYITLVIVVFILFALFSWIYSILALKSSACNKLDILYPSNSPSNRSFILTKNRVEDITKFDDIKASIFRNYYVKASYNSCCGDGYKNNFVNLCALEKAIIAGARFLDFEIYSYNNIPIVAASTSDDNNIKEVYNYLTVEEVFETLNYNSFDNSITTCANDPMILNLRFMTENTSIFNKVAKLINEKLNYNPQSNQIDSYLIKYSKEINLLKQPIKKLSKKFIIIATANPTNNIFNDTDLNDLINLKSNGEYCKTYRYDTIRSKGFNSATLEREVRHNYVIVLPNLSNDLYNYDIELPLSNGCQAICMKFQNMDTNLLSYHELFKDNGRYSFILKSESKRKDLPETYTTNNSMSNNKLTDEDIVNAVTGRSDNSSFGTRSTRQIDIQSCSQDNETICRNYNATCNKGSSGKDYCRFNHITHENICDNSSNPGNWQFCDPVNPISSTFCKENQNFPGPPEGICVEEAINFKCEPSGIKKCNDLDASYCIKSHNSPNNNICVYKNIQESDCTGSNKFWATCANGNPSRNEDWCLMNPNFPGTDPSGICIYDPLYTPS